MASQRRASGVWLRREERTRTRSSTGAPGRRFATTWGNPTVSSWTTSARRAPGGPARSAFDGVIGGGLEVTRYVELVSVTSLMAGLDYFNRANGVATLSRPALRPG